MLAEPRWVLMQAFFLAGFWRKVKKLRFDVTTKRCIASFTEKPRLISLSLAVSLSLIFTFTQLYAFDLFLWLEAQVMLNLDLILLFFDCGNAVQLWVIAVYFLFSVSLLTNGSNSLWFHALRWLRLESDFSRSIQCLKFFRPISTPLTCVESRFRQAAFVKSETTFQFLGYILSVCRFLLSF